MKITVEAGRTGADYWKELWRFRELFLFLAWRDLLVRYKQTIIGVAWAVIRPLLTMVVLTLVFGTLAKLPSNNVPYPILVFAALLPWQFFANAFSEAGNSLIVNAPMISKIYFPRLAIPCASVVVSFVDFLISLVLLAAIMAFFGFVPSIQIVYLPLFAMFAVIVALGAGLWVAALNVKFRDFRYIIPFVVQIGLYASPVGFSSSVVPEQWRLLYSLNPMVGVIDGFRWSIMGDSFPLYWPGILLSSFVAVVLLVSGLAYFRKTERHFADII